ncbi:MAG: ATP-binding cassette domain-containing protein [Chitinophagales bacterium]|nr:ATP-binding cassette domain-containing protein [Chitinophagales bacterium]
MKFQLEQVVPHPLEEADVSASQVWRKQVELHAGKFIRLQAASGRGKTTFLHILYGRRKDFSGKAFIDGNDIARMDGNKWAALRQKNISIVFQELALFSDLSGWENVWLKAMLTKHYDKDVILTLAERLNAKHLLEKKCGIMSFGERQRIAILRSLVQPFDWLFLDEPFSNLDAENSRAASSLIIEECKKRNAGLLVAALGADEYFTYHETLLV